MLSSVGSRYLPTSSQLLTLASRRRAILYRPGSARRARKGPVLLSGTILIERYAAATTNDVIREYFSRIVGEFSINISVAV
jgi:hypothetical protein